MPRTPLSPVQVATMKEELKGWFELTELTLKAAKEYSNLDDLANRDFYRMMSETLIETTILQKELVYLIPQTNPQAFDSVKTYATVKEIMGQMNLATVDPMKSLEIEGMFPQEVRDAYQELSENYRLVHGDEYLKRSRPKDLTELWRNLKPLLQKNGSDWDSETKNENPVKGYGEVASQWRSGSIQKPYFQHIVLVMDFIFYSLRMVNPPQAESPSNNAFDPGSIRFSDFLFFDKIVSLLPANILATSSPPKMADILSKIMAEFIPLYIRDFGANSEDLRSLIQDYARFSDQRPHDPFLTRLAYELSQMAELSAELRMVTMNYVKNSVFADSLAGPYNPHLENRLRHKLSERASHWTLKKGQYERSGMTYINKLSGIETSDLSSAEEALLVSQKAGVSKQCSRIFSP